MMQFDRHISLPISGLQWQCL